MTDKPLDPMFLNHDHIAMLAVKHEKEIQALKQLVTPMMEFKRREWIGLTGDEIEGIPKDMMFWKIIRAAEAILKRKNT
jgi:hypothetical protein